MHIFGDPLRIPIVIVERVMNTPRRTSSHSSYLRHMQTEPNPDTIGKKSAPQSIARVLKIVVFVHGFQACLALMEFIAKQCLTFYEGLTMLCLGVQTVFHPQLTFLANHG